MKDLTITLANDKTFQGLLADLKSAELLGMDAFTEASKAVANYMIIFDIAHTGKMGTLKVIED